MSIKLLLGSKIKELRKKGNLSQEKFSELLNMNPRQIVRIENGESFPTAENLERIAKVLNIKVQELFYIDYLQDPNSLKSEIIKSLDEISTKDLRTVYLIVKNL